MQQHTEMSWPGIIVATMIAAMLGIIFVAGLIGIISWIAGPKSHSPPAPKTIHCAQWREMGSGFFMRRMRCEQWSDGKTLADVDK